MKRVNLKLGRMRKADDCVVYPESQKNVRFVQGDRLVLYVDLTTGKARINYRTGSRYPTSRHLHDHPNVEMVQISEADVQAIIQATPRAGDQVGPGVYIA